MRTEKFWLCAICILGWALVKWGIKPESAYLGGMFIAASIVGITVCLAANYIVKSK